MSKLETTNVYKFDPVVYPFKLWVTIADDVELIVRRFRKLDGSKLSNIDGPFTGYTTGLIYEVRSGDLGVLVVFNPERGLKTSTIAHESSHVADKFWEEMGDDRIPSEANAYLVGWVAECCQKVINKFKIDNK